jgi:proteasome lid subunit RPN8/RPN11
MTFPDKLLQELKTASLSKDHEICGFITKNGQEYVFSEVENIHPDKLNYFLIHPLTTPETEYIMFHSHVLGGGFSEADMDNQKRSCISMILYSRTEDKFHFSMV